MVRPFSPYLIGHDSNNCPWGPFFHFQGGEDLFLFLKQFRILTTFSIVPICNLLRKLVWNIWVYLNITLGLSWNSKVDFSLILTKDRYGDDCNEMSMWLFNYYIIERWFSLKWKIFSQQVFLPSFLPFSLYSSLPSFLLSLFPCFSILYKRLYCLHYALCMLEMGKPL